MDKVLVIVFENEGKAYEGSKALQVLHDEGSINLYAKAVIVRDDKGKVQVRQENSLGPIGTAVGMLTGSLVGLLAGPAGMVIGGGVGMAGGFAFDMAELGLDVDYLDEVGKSLTAGKAAIVAEVWEEWMLPVDNRMEALGGVVYRRTRGEVVDIVVEKDIAATQDYLDELHAEYDRATGESKAKLQAKIDATEARLQTMQENAQSSFETSQKETEAKIQSLQEQAAKAHGERKAKLEKRIEELKADHKRREEKMQENSQKAKDSLKG